MASQPSLKQHIFLGQFERMVGEKLVLHRGDSRFPGPGPRYDAALDGTVLDDSNQRVEVVQFITRVLRNPHRKRDSNVVSSWLK